MEPEKILSVQHAYHIFKRTIFKRKVLKFMDSTKYELKVAFSKSALRQFRKRPLLRQLSTGSPKTRKLRSVYYDTSDLRLFQAGMSLRLRKKGKRVLQTAKWGTGVRHGVSTPLEIECLVKSKHPDISKFKNGRCKRNLAKLISDQPLKPIFETSIWRTTRKIRIDQSGTIELAIDHGYILAGTRSKKIQEVELELKSGHTHCLLSAAEALLSEDRIKLSEKSKAARGYEILIGGEQDPPSSFKPDKGRSPKLHRRMSECEVLSRIGRSASDQVLSNYRTVLNSTDPEGAHQLRVGVRRLRTALRTIKPVKISEELDRFKFDCRELAGIVGHLRDADVLVQDIYMPAARSVLDNPDESMISIALASHQERQVRKIRTSLKSARWTTFRLNCIFFELFVQRLMDKSDTSSRSGLIMSSSRRALEKRWRHLNRWGKRINKLSVAERHEMRKELKSLRYTIEYFRRLYPLKDSQSFLKQLKHLQDTFGYLNDVALAVRLFDIVEFSFPNRSDLQYDVERIFEFHSAEAVLAWSDALKRWKKLSRAPKFWQQS